jgi:hypothetical protein
MGRSDRRRRSRFGYLFAPSKHAAGTPADDDRPDAPDPEPEEAAEQPPETPVPPRPVKKSPPGPQKRTMPGINA